MLSIENPPLDPPSHLKIPNINHALDQKKASSSSVQQDSDLLNPVPKFSIRDYVFSSRTKDLSKNWPFSEKYVELCMKHEVSDPLPPFKRPDSVRRNPFVKRKRSGEKFYCEDVEKIHHSHDGEIPKKQDNELNFGLCKQNRAASDCLDIKLCGSEETDTDFVSKKTLLELEKHKGQEKEAIRHQHHPPVKKSKLVKSTSKEFVVLPKNYTAISESMASKGVCPVCKNFSSSSNTTLNAHIDQCLSGESTMKCAPSLPVTKYKVKPRKIRLMVDIYKSAPYCTLEELERRNGRSWPTNSSFQVQEGKVILEEKVEKVSNVNVEDNNGHEGNVYIDTDGRKVRILSKFSGVESGSKIGGDDHGARKFLKGDKVKNALSIKKRKKLKRQKQLKSISLGKNSLSRKPFHNSEACGSGQERKEPIDKKREKGEMQTDRAKDDHNQIKKGNSGTIKQLSSPTVQKKTSSGKDVHRYSGHNSNTKQLSSPTVQKKTSSGKDFYRYSGHNSNTKSVLESSPSTLGDLPLKKQTHFSKNPISSPKSSRRTDIGEHKRQLPSRERKCFSSNGSKIGGCGKSMEMNAGPLKYSDAPARKKRLFSHEGNSSTSSNAKKLSSFGNLEFVVDPKFNFKEKCSVPKKSRVHFTSDLESIVDPASDSEATSDDKEFAIEEIETQMEQNTERFFTGLNESLNNPHDSQFHQEGPMCGMEQTLMGEQGTFCSQVQNGQIVAEIEDSRAWHGNYFSDVNAISIPGPPGSFLPSLEDLGSEDLQGNSSLTSCRVQSSEEPQDYVVYRHSPDSLVSADSAISHPSLAGFDSKSSQKLHVQLPIVQTEDSVRVPLVDICAPAGSVFLEKRLEVDNSRCSSWKEGLLQVCGTSNCQDSPRLERWSVDSVPLAPTGSQWSGSDLNTRVGIPSLRMEMFNALSSGAENADIDGVKSPVGPEFPVKVSGDSSSPSPESDYPVLRLMGKNLMVVNKDQGLPLQQRQKFDGRFSNNFIYDVDPGTLLHASRVPIKTGNGGSSGNGSSSGVGFTATLERDKYEGGIQYAN